MLCYVVLRRVVSVRLCYVVLYCFVFCFVRLCYVVLVYVVLCYVVLCFVLCVRGNKITNLSDSSNQVYKQPKQTHSYMY